MIILGVIASIFCICVWRWRANDRWNNEGWILGCIVSGVVLGLFVLSVPLSQLDSMNSVIRFEAAMQTIEDARTSGDGLEGAAGRISVIDLNKWLASAQYWNDTVFDIWIHDSVDDLEPIRIGSDDA